MSDREELLAVIEAHTMSTQDETCCSCGAWFNSELCAIDIQHRDHLADALAPFIERAKAEALREAADASDDEATEVERKAPPGCTAFTQRRRAEWLRARADAIEKGTDR